MNTISHKWTHIIEAPHLDPVYGHVSHYGSLKLLESARAAMISQHGWPLERLLQGDLFIVVTQLQVEYLREVRQEIITVLTEFSRYEKKRLDLTQSLFTEKGKCAVHCSVTLACMRGSSRRAEEFPEAFLSIFRAPFSPVSAV